MTAETHTAYTDGQRKMMMIPLMLGGFIALLNETFLNVAFPQLMAVLHVSTSTVQWLGTGYMLTIGVLVPVVAFLLKTFSTRKLYLAGMGLFTAGTVCCGVAQSFAVLLTSRLMQAVGTGVLVPIMINTIMEIYPPQRRGAALGLGMMAVVVGPGLGPCLSGIILQCADWHWLFHAMLPWALFATVFGAFSLRDVTVLTKPRIDVLSVLLSSAGFGGLIYGTCSVQGAGLASVATAVSLVCGVGGLLLFARRQAALAQPMLDLRVFDYPMFRLGAVLIFITFMMPFGVNIILPTYWQSGLGVTPLVAGLALLPGSLANGLLAPLSGRLYDRMQARPLAIAGFVALTLSMLFFARLSATTPLVLLVAAQVCMTAGVALISTPVQAHSLGVLPQEHRPHGVAVLSTVQQVSAAFGFCLFIGLMAAVQQRHLLRYEHPAPLQHQAALVSGVNAAFSAALVTVVVGLALSFLTRHHERS